MSACYQDPMQQNTHTSTTWCLQDAAAAVSKDIIQLDRCLLWPPPVQTRESSQNMVSDAASMCSKITRHDDNQPPNVWKAAHHVFLKCMQIQCLYAHSLIAWDCFVFKQLCPSPEETHAEVSALGSTADVPHDHIYIPSGMPSPLPGSSCTHAGSTDALYSLRCWESKDDLWYYYTGCHGSLMVLYFGTSWQQAVALQGSAREKVIGTYGRCYHEFHGDINDLICKCILSEILTNRRMRMPVSLYWVPFPR